MQEILRVTWQVAPLQCPLVWRHCSRCKIAMPFACSMKFRTNAQKKRVDVWLIYRCRACEETWNLPLHERLAVSDIAPELFQAIARNDPALARRYAFDRQRLAPHGRVEEPAAFEIRKSPREECDGNASVIDITLALAWPCGIRLDRLLASELGVTRNQLRTLHDRGALRVLNTRPLRSPIADGLSISIELSDAAIQPALAATIRQGALEQRSRDDAP